MAQPLKVNLEPPRDDLAEDIRRFRIQNGTRYFSQDGEVYIVNNLGADGRMTLSREQPKVRGKAARKAEKRARHDAGARAVQRRSTMKLSDAVKNIRSRYVAKFPVPQGEPGPTFEEIARQWSIRFARQVAYELPGQGYGMKRADGGRPISKDTLARQSGDTLLIWDLLSGTGTGHPTLVGDPDSQDVTGQIFVEVEPLDSLGTAPAPLSINLSSVEVIGSNRDALSFARSATLSRFALVPGRMTIASTGTDNWPAIGPDPNDRDGQAGTLWIFLHIGGKWFATGAERLRKYQLNGNKPEATPGEGTIGDLVGSGWLYDVNRWGVMTGYNPQPGEAVGLMLVSGSTRSEDVPTVRQRSNVVVVAWPDNNGADPVRVLWDEAGSVQPPVEEPPVPPVPPVPPAGPDPVILEALRRLEQKVDGIAGLAAHLENLVKAGDDNNERRYLDVVAHFQNLPIVKGFTGTVSIFGVRATINLEPKQ